MSLPKNPPTRKSEDAASFVHAETAEAALEAARRHLRAVFSARVGDKVVSCDFNGELFVFPCESVDAERLADFLYNAVSSFMSYVNGIERAGKRTVTQLMQTKKGRPRIKQREKDEFFWRLLECINKLPNRMEPSLVNIASQMDYLNFQTLQRQLKSKLGLTWSEFVERCGDPKAYAKELLALRKEADDALRQLEITQSEDNAKIWLEIMRTMKEKMSLIEHGQKNP